MTFMRRWPYTFAVCLSIAAGLWAFIASQSLGLPMRDPDGFLGPAYVRLPVIVLAFFAAGIIPAAIKRAGVRDIARGFREIVAEEWTVRRFAYITMGLVTFYACYVSYRNVKSYLPVVREGVLYDHDMLQLDHFLFFGNNPAQVLHDTLGTGVSAQVLAAVYVSYLMLVPLSLGAFLVWSKDFSLGAWYATALSLNWVLGAVSYYIIPTLGPAFAQPSMFADLPETSAASLQQSLFKAGASFKEDPTGNHIYGIAGFASLHVSVVVSACIFFVRTGQRRSLQIGAWIYLVLVVLATLYFGWHYVADDIAGAFIGWLSISIGAWASGNRGRRRRKKQVSDELPPSIEAEPAI
jgi:hypothetical protein